MSCSRGPAAFGLVAALVLAACGSSTNGSGRPGPSTGGASTSSSASSPPGTSSSPGSSSATSSSGPSSPPVAAQEFLTTSDLARAGIAADFAEQQQSSAGTTASARSTQVAVFGCLNIFRVLAHVPGTTSTARGARSFTDPKGSHVLIEIVAHFESAGQVDRFGRTAAHRLAACTHPAVAVAGKGTEISTNHGEQLQTSCDESTAFTDIAIRNTPQGQNEQTFSTLLVGYHDRFAYAMNVGPAAANSYVVHSKLGDAICARLKS